MTTKHCLSILLLAGGLCLSGSAADSLTTAALDSGELEAVYTAAIEQRASDILDALALEDAVTKSRVHDAIVNQYRALRARDAVLDAYFRAQGATETDSPERQALSTRVTKPLHEMYVSTLSAYLPPEQVEVVKDRMTYNKVKWTFDAYCVMLPKLTDDEKAMIREVLEAARDEAMDGGSANEKHAIFERYKDQINARLTADGHDVEKAFKELEAKRNLASSADPDAEAASN